MKMNAGVDRAPVSRDWMNEALGLMAGDTGQTEGTARRCRICGYGPQAFEVIRGHFLAVHPLYASPYTQEAGDPR